MTAPSENGAIDELDAELQDFELDDREASLPFSHRLARDHGWRHSHALRVIREYKRFVYLAMRAGHPVTPSEEVDCAWHLHLCYTRSYWEVMCADILKAPLHHGPTRGGGEEAGKYCDWYRATLASYERIYGERPPPDIWPDVRARFVSRYRWVDRNRFLILKKPALGALLSSLLVAGGCLIATGCTGSEFTGIPVFFGVCLFLVLMIALIGGGRGGRGGGRGGGSFWTGGGGVGCGGGTGCGGGGGGCGGGGD